VSYVNVSPRQYFIEIATDMKLCPSIELGLGQDIIVSYVNVSPRQYFIEIATVKEKESSNNN
jgi:hypothetical protein